VNISVKEEGTSVAQLRIKPEIKGEYIYHGNKIRILEGQKDSFVSILKVESQADLDEILNTVLPKYAAFKSFLVQRAHLKGSVAPKELVKVVGSKADYLKEIFETYSLKKITFKQDAVSLIKELTLLDDFEKNSLIILVNESFKEKLTLSPVVYIVFAGVKLNIHPDDIATLAGTTRNEVVESFGRLKRWSEENNNLERFWEMVYGDKPVDFRMLKSVNVAIRTEVKPSKVRMKSIGQKIKKEPVEKEDNQIEKDKIYILNIIKELENRKKSVKYHAMDIIAAFVKIGLPAVRLVNLLLADKLLEKNEQGA